MDVQVRNRLPGGGAVVDADVPAVGTVLLLDGAPRDLYRVEDRAAFRGSRVEERADVAVRDDEHVPR